ILTQYDRMSEKYVLQNDGQDFKVDQRAMAGCSGGSSCSGGTPQAAPDCRCQYPGASGVRVNEALGVIGGSEYTASSDKEHVDGNSVIAGVLVMDFGGPWDFTSGDSSAHAMLELTILGNQSIKDFFVYLPEVVDAGTRLKARGFKLDAGADD